jgi:hypothetical protein
MDRAMELAQAGAYDDDNSRLWWSLFFFLLDRNDSSYVAVARTLLVAIGEDDGARERGPDPGAGERAGPRPRGTIGHAARAAVHLTAIFGALDVDDRDVALEHLRTARRYVEAAAPAELAAFDEHLHVMLLLVEGSWAAMTGDQAGHRSTSDAAVALADADGRPFPRAVARGLAAATGPYVAEPAYVLELAAQALELAHRFGFGWLAAIAGCSHGWADAHVNGTTADAARTIEAQVAEVVAAGRLGNEAVLLLMLADVYALEQRTDAARDALLRARRNPGPYRGVFVDLVDGRLRRLDREDGRRAT